MPKDVGKSMNPLEFHRNNFPSNGKIEVIPKVELTKETLSLAYTPGIAKVSLRIAENPDEVYEYTNRGNTVTVVSDGSRVLGSVTSVRSLVCT